MGEGSEGLGGRRGGGRRERGEQFGKRKGVREKEENFACAKRAPAQRKKRETRGWDGRRGRAPGHHLIHPFMKKHKFRVVAEFNPRRQYIGVYLKYFELFIYSENWVTVS